MSITEAPKCTKHPKPNGDETKKEKTRKQKGNIASSHYIATLLTSYRSKSLSS